MYATAECTTESDGGFTYVGLRSTRGDVFVEVGDFVLSWMYKERCRDSYTRPHPKSNHDPTTHNGVRDMGCALAHNIRHFERMKERKCEAKWKFCGRKRAPRTLGSIPHSTVRAVLGGWVQ